MDNQNNILSFEGYIRSYCPNYLIDNSNDIAINAISLWAARSYYFNLMVAGYHMDKGLLLQGGTGTGKTDMMKLLNRYLSGYLKSQYRFQEKVVWEFAAPYSKKDVGYMAFANEEVGNIFYDELCLTNDRSVDKEPTREFASHFGNKILIGEELILKRYNSFKNAGYMTHFTTNASDEMLLRQYGQRAYSRLQEMCNFISLTGVDRRKIGHHNIWKNHNAPAPPPVNKEVTQEEIQENKDMIDMAYREYVQNGTLQDIMAIVYYDLMRQYGCDMGDESRMAEYMNDVAQGYQEPLIRTNQSGRDKMKREFVFKESRKLAVMVFFSKLKQANAVSVFAEVEVQVEGNKVSKK